MDDEMWELLRSVYDDRFEEATYPYPLGGYDEVMEETFVRTGKGEGARVLDIWAGEGNLAAHFYAAGSQVTCVARSESHAARLLARMPQVSVIHAGDAGDLAGILRVGGEVTGPLDALHGECTQAGFDAVVCGGGLLGGRMQAYTACVEGIFERFLPGRKGVLCWADTSFKNETARCVYEADMTTPRALVWEAWREALVPRRFRVQYSQLAPCMGLYKIKRR